jgi:hypothetical protein
MEPRDYLEELYGVSRHAARKPRFLCINSGQEPAVKGHRVHARIADGSIVCLDEGTLSPTGYVATKFVCNIGGAPGELIEIEATSPMAMVVDPR